MRTARISLLLLFAGAAWADYFDRNSLKKLMDSERTIDEAMYRGYVAGVQDSYNGVLFCVHEGVRMSQASAIVKKYFADNPKNWHMAAQQLVINALTESFPCKK